MRAPHEAVGTDLSTEEGVYGLILVAGLVAVAGASGLGAIQTLVFMLVTVGVFWAAHVYSGAVAVHSGSREGPDGPRDASLRDSIRYARRRSRGLLTAIIPPAIPILLSALGVLEIRVAVWIALWLIVAVLAMLGYIAYRRRGAPLHMRVLGAVSTAAFGIVIIVAKALLHH